MCLINLDGAIFSAEQLEEVRNELAALQKNERIEYRNKNAEEIAKCGADKIVIVSGPGTGKSYLFLSRISHWFDQTQDAKILVTSFVRKLVADLDNDVQSSLMFTEDNKKKATVITLHKLARSIVERNHGTSDWRFQSYFGMLGEWNHVIWTDIMAFHEKLDSSEYTLKNLENQMYNDSFDKDPKWQALKQTYFVLCKFYNASGFADLILRAKVALQEKPSLNDRTHFIVDEYQDFNQAEQNLILELVKNSESILIVGDDEQVLYEELKSGKPQLIRELYGDKQYTKAMLPFCGRCGHHIVRCSEAFISEYREKTSIEKVFLPIEDNISSSKVEVIACPNSGSAADFIASFVDTHKTEIDKRKTELESGKVKDPFLLILSRSNKLKFFGKDKEKIFELVAEYKSESARLSQDYYRLLTYYALAENPANNFNFRKVMYYEKIESDVIHELIESSLENDQGFQDSEESEVKQIKSKCRKIKDIINASVSSKKIIKTVSKLLQIDDPETLLEEIEARPINKEQLSAIEKNEEENLVEFGMQQLSAIELMTIVGSKGLSAEYVIIVGFDDVNMKSVKPNAFYVALTRARKGVQLITAMQSGGSKRAHNYIADLPNENTEYFKYKKSDGIKVPLNSRRNFDDYFSKLEYAKKMAMSTKFSKKKK